MYFINANFHFVIYLNRVLFSLLRKQKFFQSESYFCKWLIFKVFKSHTRAIISFRFEPPKKRFSKNTVQKVCCLKNCNYYTPVFKTTKDERKSKHIQRNELKQYTERKTKNRNKAKGQKTAKARNKRVFLLETFFWTLENQKMPVRFGTLKECVK